MYASRYRNRSFAASQPLPKPSAMECYSAEDCCTSHSRIAPPQDAKIRALDLSFRCTSIGDGWESPTSSFVPLVPEPLDQPVSDAFQVFQIDTPEDYSFVDKVPMRFAIDNTMCPSSFSSDFEDL